MGNSFTLMLMYFIGIIPITIINYIMPSLLRKNVFFGVTIPSIAKKEPELKGIERSYRKRVLFGFTILTFIYFYISRFIPIEKISLVFMLLILTYLIYFYSIYISAWKKTKLIKAQMKWDVESKNIAVANLNINENKIRLNPIWFLTYVVLMIVTFFVSYKLYLAAPDQIPIRYDFAGNVSAYTTKSLKILYIGLVSQSLMSILMFIVFLANTKARVDIDPTNLTISSKQTIAYKYRWSIFMFVVGFFLNIIIGFTQIAILASFSTTIITVFPLVATVVIIGYAIVLALKTGQSGNRISFGKELENKVATKKDDDNWVGGLFYYNPKDPSLFIEKRSGIGYTLNFANKISWIIGIGLIIFIGYSLTR